MKPASLLTPPDDLLKLTSGMHFDPIDLARETPDLLALFQGHEEASRAILSPQIAGQWYRNGAGPAPTQGGVWVGGTILTPLSVPPTSGIVTSFNYSYDNTHFGGWTSQISVRLLVVNAAGTQSWAADITASNTGTVGASGLNIPANCQMQFQMKVGNLQSSLFQPPYISPAGAYVYYNY